MKRKLGKIPKRAETAILLTFVYFIMLMFYINEPFFASDEGDIYLMGSVVANGNMIYRDVRSQHMPVMYYISAIFALFGVSSVTVFRICFYMLMAVLWGVMYYRYSKHIDKRVVALYPVIYIIMLGFVDMGHAVLSDQFQGICMAILLFELLIFEKTRELKTGNMVMISLAVFLSFGSAFVAAFAIFFVALTVIALELQRYAQMKIGPIRSVGKLFTDYWKLIVFVAAPFVVLLLFYLVTGTLDDFYNWAYVLNMTVYPKYTGYGGSGGILDSMFGGIKFILAELALPASGASLARLAFFVITVGAVCFFVRLQKERKNWILAGGILLFWIGAATRGYTNFHGTPALAVACVMFACALCGVIDDVKKNAIALSAVALVIVSFMPPYVSQIVDFSPGTMLNSMKMNEGSKSHIVDILTEDGEIIGFSTLDTHILFESNTVPSKLNGSCIWTWEFSGKEDLQECIENPPRVFVFNRDSAIWGYSMQDYAPEINDFIQENYTNLDPIGHGDLYIRNDYYEEALVIINEDAVRHTGYAMLQSAYDLDLQNNTVEVKLIGKNPYQGVQFATWSDEGGQDDLFWYDAEQNADGSWSYVIDLDEHQTLGRYYIHVYTNDGQKISLLRELSFVVE